jgi:hypothetical protein
MECLLYPKHFDEEAGKHGKREFQVEDMLIISLPEWNITESRI